MKNFKTYAQFISEGKAVDKIKRQEEDAAEFILKSPIKKPMSAFIAGVSAPKGKRMGHAGAIISGNKGTAQSKIKALQLANITVAPSPAKMGETMLAEMQKGYN